MHKLSAVPTLSFALQDPAHGLASIFRPLQRGTVRQKLDVRQDFDGDALHWRGPDQLDVADQTVLLVLLALAGVQKTQLCDSPETESGRKLRAALEMSGPRANETAAFVQTSWTSLMAEVGYRHRGGKAMKLVQQSIQRLAEVTLWVTSKGQTTSTRLLTWVLGNDSQVVIAVNYRLATAIFGGQFVRISLVERRELEVPAAKVLHGWFSSRLRRGGKGCRFAIKDLVQRVWGDEVVGQSAQRTRRSVVSKALRELGDLAGWDVRVVRGAAVVTRS